MLREDGRDAPLHLRAQVRLEQREHLLLRDLAVAVGVGLGEELAQPADAHLAVGIDLDEAPPHAVAEVLHQNRQRRSARVVGRHPPRMRVGVRLEGGRAPHNVRVDQRRVDATLLERRARHADDGERLRVDDRRVVGVQRVGGLGRLAAVGGPPRPAALLHGGRECAPLEAHADVLRGERALGVEVGEGDEAVDVLLLGADGARVDQADLARIDGLLHGGRDQRRHRALVLAHAYRRQVARLAHGEHRRLERLGRLLQLLEQLEARGVGGVAQLERRALVAAWLRERHQPHAHPRRRRGRRRRVGVPDEVDDGAVEGVLARLDNVRAVRLLDEDGVVVAAQDAREAKAARRQQPVVLDVLVRQRHHAVHAGMGGLGARHGVLHRLRHGQDPSRMPIKGVLPVEGGVLAAAAAQADERNRSAARKPHELMVGARARLELLRIRLAEGAHVGVEPHPVELVDALQQRRVRDVALVVAEAHVVDWHRVEHGDHAAALVDRREQRRRHEIARAGRDEILRRQTLPHRLHARMQRWQVVELVRVVDVHDSQVVGTTRFHGRLGLWSRRPPSSTTRNHAIKNLKTCAFTQSVLHTMPSEIGPPCSCFSTCDPISTRRFLQDIPATVTSASSPWYAYLRAVYAGDVPPLPFHLTRLRYVHHHDTAWRRKHPDVEWPMPPCGKLPQPLGGTPDGQWWAPMTWQGRKRIKPLRTPQCEAAVCSRWKTGEGDAQNQTRRQAAREEELKLHVELFAGEGNRTTRGTRWHFTTRRGVNPDVLLPNESWVEVMRTRVTGEGANGNGVWYSRAAGSGIWINVGRRTWHIADKQEATGIRPHRPGLPGDLVTPWLRHAFGRLQEGDLIRRTPQFWAKLYERSANITHAQLSAHLMAHEGFELRPVMLRPQVRCHCRTHEERQSRSHVSAFAPGDATAARRWGWRRLPLHGLRIADRQRADPHLRLLGRQRRYERDRADR